jgi:hypothetical protein
MCRNEQILFGEGMIDNLFSYKMWLPPSSYWYADFTCTVLRLQAIGQCMH